MNTLIKADIFFFITAVSVVALTILLVIALVYVVRILRQVFFVSQRVREESEKVAEDLETLRQEARTGGRRVRDDVLYLSGQLRAGGKKLTEDLSAARAAVKQEATIFKRLFTYLTGFLTISSRRRSKSSQTISNNKRAKEK